MVLKGIKKFFAQKRIQKFLAARTGRIGARPVRKIGVLINTDEFRNPEEFFKLKEFLKAEVEVVVFSEMNKKLEEFGDEILYYNPAQVSFNGRIKNPELNAFAQKDFDLLINYTNNNRVSFNLLSAASKANLKVGISLENQSLYDLIIQTEIADFKAFSTELKKYLQQLNMLNDE